MMRERKEKIRREEKDCNEAACLSCFQHSYNHLEETDLILPVAAGNYNYRHLRCAPYVHMHVVHVRILKITIFLVLSFWIPFSDLSHEHFD